MPMPIFNHQPLQAFNTLALPATAAAYLSIESEAQLSLGVGTDRPSLILGGGSNMLLSTDFTGLVLHNNIKGIEIRETEHEYHLDIGGGENWHQLVCYCVERGIGGLENLAMIPGSIGAAPVQNIGAYGVEFAEYCAFVDTIDIETGAARRFTKEECCFGYRNSLFKKQRNYFITRVGLRLPKLWLPRLQYGELQSWKQQQQRSPTPAMVAAAVAQIRAAKLPDPTVLANAGSFFKNPEIPTEAAIKLRQQYIDMPCYERTTGTKLAAGWLIEQCGLKGYALGDAQIHQRQALVLVNRGEADAQQLLMLARLARQRVAEQFDVILEPEVNIVGATGYVDLDGMAL